MDVFREWIVISFLAFLLLVLVLSSLARVYRKVGPHQALVVYGYRNTRIIKGGGTFIFPMFETYRELSLQLMSFDVAPQQDLYTMQGVAVTVEAVSQIKVKSDPESIVTAVVQWIGAADEQTGATRAPGPPILITAPLPNCRSIWVSAPCSAAWRLASDFGSADAAASFAPVFSSFMLVWLLV